MKSKWQQSIEEFMRKAGQNVPDEPTQPTEEERILRAKLIMEEALETIRDLGVDTYFKFRKLDPNLMRFEISDQEFNMEGVADGCADILVVTIGTLSCCGVMDTPIMHEVNQANLRKFDLGGYRREDGKWMKPPDWQPPDIQGKLKAMGFQQ